MFGRGPSTTERGGPHKGIKKIHPPWYPENYRVILTQSWHSPAGEVIKMPQPASFFTTDRSLSASKGLTIHPVAPAAFPSSIFEPCDSVVRTIIGVNL